MAHSIFERYKHYDPEEEGYGSPDEWAALADVLADRVINGFEPEAAEPIRKALKSTRKINPDLEILMLDSFPKDVVRLKLAYRNSLFLYHPDHGGDEEKCRLAIEAYGRLLRRFTKRKGAKHGKG